MRWLGMAAGLILGLAAAQARADCPAGAPEGLFVGKAVAPGDEPRDVSLNLFCAEGRYQAQFYTSQGDPKVLSASGRAGGLRFDFESGGGPGHADLTLNGEALAGDFIVGGGKGQLTLTRKGPSLGPDGLRPRLDLTPEQWREDLAAFAEGLPKRHANAFATLPKPRFDAEVAALAARLPRLNGDEVFVGLQKIVNLIGDGHTGLVFPPQRAVLPLAFGRFGQDIRVTSAGPGLQRALGARLVAIDGTPAAEAWRRALTLTPRDELPALREDRALTDLRIGLALHGLGVSRARDHAAFTLRADTGPAFTLEVAALTPGAPAPVMTPAAGKRGLADKHPGTNFWCETQPGDTVYCDFRAYPDLQARAAEMFALIDQSKARRLVLDLRDNGGGDNTQGYRWLVLPLKLRADLNQKGRLYVLVGTDTFSAAMNNAAQFQDLTAATLVGQQIGEKPNSYQEPRQFRLPNSHLVVRASTQFYKFKAHGPNAVTPDKTIAPTWADVKAGRDPVLDWVLAQPPPS